MEEILRIMSCPICGCGEVGQLFIAKNENNNFFVICDECQAIWNNPEEILIKEGQLQDKVIFAIPATREEIQTLGWDYCTYILKLPNGEWENLKTKEKIKMLT